MFLHRSEFYMTIRFSHAFLLIFWVGILRLFFNIFVLVKLFFAFFRGVRGRSPRKFFEIFQFFDAGGLPRIFSWLFSDFLMSEKNRGGGVRRKIFSWRHFFTAPKGNLTLFKIITRKKYGLHFSIQPLHFSLETRKDSLKIYSQYLKWDSMRCRISKNEKIWKCIIDM